MDAFETLTAAYLDRQLTEPEAVALAHALENDMEKAARFLDEYEIDRLLAVRGMPADESRIDAIMAQIQDEEDPFVQSVFRTIERESSASIGRAPSWRDRLDRLFPRPGWALLTAAGVGFLCCAWFFYFGLTAGAPRLAFEENSSIDVIRNGVSMQAQHGFALRAGDLLNAGTNVATIRYAPEETWIRIEPGAELRLVSASGAKRLALNAGKMEASVARQRAFHPMIVLTSQAEARVLGTRFTLIADTNATRLEVTGGQVKFTPATGGKPVKVRAGNYAVAGADYELAALPLTRHILREYWTNLTGNALFPAGSPLASERASAPPPDGWDYLERFESKPVPGARGFFERIRGYVHPPKSGLYRFAVTTTHVESALHVSRTDKPEEIVQVAWRHPDGGGNTLENVTPVPLEAGRKYYIEIVHESDGGAERLTVMWRAPGRPPEIVPGEFLSPFETPEQQPK
jgi:hypothetical protein